MNKVIRVWIWLCHDSGINIHIYCLKLVLYFQEAYFIFFIIWVPMMVWLSSLYVSKTNNKLHKNTTVKYQIQESTFSASCLCAERGGVLLRSKRTAFGSVEGRISWILLQQNQPNACVLLYWKWGNAKLTGWKGNPRWNVCKSCNTVICKA